MALFSGSLQPVRNYPWKRIAPGTYAQEYDSFLTLQHMWSGLDASGRRLLQSTSYVKLQTGIPDPELEPKLRAAWVAMRYNHPGLAMELDEYYKLYKIPYPEEVDAWLVQTFHTYPSTSKEELQKHHLSPASNPQLYWLPMTQEVVLVGHHCYFDARSMWVFWEKFLELVINPPQTIAFGDEWKRLPMARDDLIGLPMFPSLLGFSKAQSLLVDAFKADAGQEFVSLPVLNTKTDADGHVIPGGADRNGLLRHAITLAETDALVKACKQRGVSVTAAFYTALALTCRKIQGDHGKAGDLALSFHNFDARSWFQDPDDIAKLTIGTDLHGVLPFTLDLTSGSFEQVVGITDANFKTLRDTFAKDSVGLDAVNHVFKGFFRPGMPVSSFPNFSSFGVGERFLRNSFGKAPGQTITIEDSYTVNHSMLEGMSCVSCWTWRGVFQTSVTFNEAYHSEDMFQQLLKDSCDAMLAGLGVSVDGKGGTNGQKGTNGQEGTHGQEGVIGTQVSA